MKFTQFRIHQRQSNNFKVQQSHLRFKKKYVHMCVHNFALLEYVQSIKYLDWKI